jgi:hypothetical protein
MEIRTVVNSLLLLYSRRLFSTHMQDEDLSTKSSIHPPWCSILSSQCQGEQFTQLEFTVVMYLQSAYGTSSDRHTSG